MEKYEIEKLRSLSCEGVAQRLGITVQHHKALCPFHDDHTPSLTFKKNKFRCFVCGASGGTIDLVMRFLNKDFRYACQWLADEHNIILADESTQKALGPKGRFACEEPSLLCTFDATRYERYFEHPFLNEAARRFLFEERRLDERVVRWCRLSSWTDRQGVPWLQIPYYNREGQLVGVQNRNLRKSPSGDSGGLSRFRFPRGSQCGIYNLPVLNLLRPGDDLYIAEGCSDCWALLSAGHKAIAIPSATLLTQKNKDLLRNLPSSKLPSLGEGSGVGFIEGLGVGLHMYPDRDAPGERLFLQLQQVFPSLVHHQLPPDCKDYSEYYLKCGGRPP